MFNPILPGGGPLDPAGCSNVCRFKTSSSIVFIFSDFVANLFLRLHLKFRLFGHFWNPKFWRFFDIDQEIFRHFKCFVYLTALSCLQFKQLYSSKVCKEVILFAQAKANISEELYVYISLVEENCWASHYIYHSDFEMHCKYKIFVLQKTLCYFNKTEKAIYFLIFPTLPAHCCRYFSKIR